MAAVTADMTEVTANLDSRMTCMNVNAIARMMGMLESSSTWTCQPGLQGW